MIPQVDELHSLLVGGLHTPVTLTLQKATAGGQCYAVTVLRHNFHSFDRDSHEKERKRLRARSAAAEAIPGGLSGHSGGRVISEEEGRGLRRGGLGDAATEDRGVGGGLLDGLGVGGGLLDGLRHAWSTPTPSHPSLPPVASLAGCFRNLATARGQHRRKHTHTHTPGQSACEGVEPSRQGTGSQLWRSGAHYAA